MCAPSGSAGIPEALPLVGTHRRLQALELQGTWGFTLGEVWGFLQQPETTHYQMWVLVPGWALSRTEPMSRRACV